MPVPGMSIHNDIEMSSPRRRSIVPQFASTPYIANDDEVERLKRRTNSELQKRVSSLRGANTSNVSSESESGELNESKLQDHYQTCVKLFTENKINAKNAWNVHIVEYMQAMLKKGLVMKDTLKLASTSIDIGCKVYCLKVDQVHSDLFKLASAMARVNIEDNRENGDNDAGDSSADESMEANQKKEKKKKKPRKNLDTDCEITIATNEKTLDGIIAPHNTAIQQISSGKSRLYTLSTITKHRWGYEQMVNSRSKFPYYTSLENDTENVKISVQKVPVTIPSANTQIICPSFADFILDRWQPDDDDVPMGTQRLSTLTQNNVVYDAHGLPIPELDASVHEPDDHDNVFEDTEEIVETAVGHAEIRRPVAFITEMRPGQGPLSDVPLQYSYRSAPVVSDRYMLSGVWAGPSHWKIKSLQRRTVNGDGASVNVVPQRGRRTKKSEPEIVCFDVESDEEDILLPFKKNKKKKRVRRGSLSKVTLPEDLNITTEDLCSIKNRPKVFLKVENSAEGDSAHTSRVNLNMTANYQYDNPDDADYCSQTLNDNGDADGDEQNDSNTDNNDILQQTLTDENMVNMPSQVQKFHVPYATQAKRMDMRKLKDAIWKSMAITETGDNHILENDEELQGVKLNQVNFSKMYKLLPSQITNRMAEELSAPLAFVALLHLANEETLKLEGTPDLNDIFISTNK